MKFMHPSCENSGAAPANENMIKAIDILDVLNKPGCKRVQVHHNDHTDGQFALVSAQDPVGEAKRVFWVDVEDFVDLEFERSSSTTLLHC